MLKIVTGKKEETTFVVAMGINTIEHFTLNSFASGIVESITLYWIGFNLLSYVEYIILNIVSRNDPCSGLRNELVFLDILYRSYLVRYSMSNILYRVLLTSGPTPIEGCCSLWFPPAPGRESQRFLVLEPLSQISWVFLFFVCLSSLLRIRSRDCAILHFLISQALAIIFEFSRFWLFLFFRILIFNGLFYYLFFKHLQFPDLRNFVYDV